MKTETPKVNNNINEINSKPKNKKGKRTKKNWSEREEKTLFILQMALGTKFSIIQSFIKDKEVADIKNHFYSKLRTYLSIQLSKLKTENFFQEIDQNLYDIKKVLSLILSNKIPTMILNKNIIKELILNDIQENKKKNEGIINVEPTKKEKLKKKRGRPSKKNFLNKSYKIKFEKETNLALSRLDENKEDIEKKIIKKNILKNEEKIKSNNITIDLDEDIENKKK